MRVRSPLLYCLCCLVLLGCKQEFKSNTLPILPTHWRHIAEQGTDTKVGRFVSTQKDLVIHYDIGPLAGEYASSMPYPNREWLRDGRLGDSSFRYLLDNDGTLYVTIPYEGPANFWAKVDGQADIDYVLELLARHRQDLLRRRDDA